VPTWATAYMAELSPRLFELLDRSGQTLDLLLCVHNQTEREFQSVVDSRRSRHSILRRLIAPTYLDRREVSNIATLG
jgi:hypothetical protein